MNVAVGVFCIVFALGTSSFCQKPGVAATLRSRNLSNDAAAEQQLIEVEQKAYRDTLNGNLTAVAGSIATDFVGWDSGVWNGKTHWVSWDKSALTRDIEGSKGMLADIHVDNLQARVYGETGVVRGRALFKRKDGTVIETQFLDTWIRRDGRWIQIAGANFTRPAR